MDRQFITKIFEALDSGKRILVSKEEILKSMK